MSIHRDMPEVEVQSDPNLALARFEAESLVRVASLGTQTGRLIHTVTLRPEGHMRGEQIIIGQNSKKPNAIRPVAGLRIVEADAGLNTIRVLDINRTPTEGSEGVATVTDLCRWGTDFVVSVISRHAFNNDQPYNFRLMVRPGGVAKFYFGMEGAEVLANGRGYIVTDVMGGPLCREFTLAADIDKAIGPVRIDSHPD